MSNNEIIKQKKADALYNMLTRKSNKPKSSSPPLIELRKILNRDIKLREDNPKLRLSIEDYNLMCKNKILRKMMARTLDTDIKSLTAYCKDVKILEEYVDLSQRTIKEKAKAKLLPIKTLLTDLPADSIRLITDHYKSLLKYKLVDWVKDWMDKDYENYKIHGRDTNYFDNLSANRNAIDFLTLPETINKINYYFLSDNTNPKALLLIEKKIIEEQKLSRTEVDKLSNRINWYSLSCNPIAVELLEKYENKIDWSGLVNNPNPDALRLIKKELKRDVDSENIDWEELSANPMVFQLLKENPDYIDYIDYSGLSMNPSPEAIQLLKENPDEIEYAMLAGNTNPEALKIFKKGIKSHRDEIDWVQLAGNTAPEATKIVKEFLHKLHLDGSDWEVTSALSSNSSDEAIQLLKENNKLIDWKALSSNTNPKALEMLQANQSRIYWPSFSTNPSIFIIK